MRALKWLIPILAVAFIAYAIGTSYPNWITTEPKPVMILSPEMVRLQVLNASGVIGAGKSVRDYLALSGFDIYEDRNNDEILPHTRIIDRLDPQMGYAREIQKFLTVPGRRLGPVTIRRRGQPEIGSKVDSLLYLEATVLLGTDYATFFPVNPRPF
jgi:hypothetical protein